MPVAFDVNVPVLKKEDVTALGAREVESRLKDAAQKAHELWAEYDRTDGKLSADEAKAIRSLNDNMAVLKERHEELTELAGMRAKQDAEYQRQTQPLQRPGMFQPGPQAQGKEQDPYAGKSLGEIFVGSKSFTEFDRARAWAPSTELEVGAKLQSLGFRAKALLDTTGFAPESVRSGLILGPGERRPVVADLIPQGTTNQAAIVYMEETTTTNNAAFVAEAGQKPESALAFTEKSSTVRKIATVLPVTEELFADAPAMEAYVNARLGAFLELAEESSLLTGTGTAPQFYGIYNVPGIQTQAKGADPVPDAIFKAITKIQTGAFLMPSGVVIHPNDWQDVRLLRTADGVYIWGSPSEAGPQRIWGLPVVSTVAATENTAIVADFATAMQIFRRTGVQFAVSDQHSDFFITNKLMLRVEERLAFVVYRPSAVCTVSGI